MRQIIRCGKYQNLHSSIKTWQYNKCLRLFSHCSFSYKHPNESVLHFNDLMQLLDVHEKLNVFLLMGTSNNRMVAIISRYFENNPERFKRIIICSRSPFVIYKVKSKPCPRCVNKLFFQTNSVQIENFSFESKILNWFVDCGWTKWQI